MLLPPSVCTRTGRGSLNVSSESFEFSTTGCCAPLSAGHAASEWKSLCALLSYQKREACRLHEAELTVIIVLPFHVSAKLFDLNICRVMAVSKQDRVGCTRAVSSLYRLGRGCCFQVLVGAVNVLLDVGSVRRRKQTIVDFPRRRVKGRGSCQFCRL